jgi:cobalamin transport system ATP-binding protein
MIRVEGLSFGYGRRAVFADLDLEVRKGEILGILGPNGCGKSTLLRLLRGILRLDAGRVFWGDEPLVGMGRRQMARLAAVVPQAAPAAFPFSVYEMVAMGRFALGGAFASLDAEGRKAVEKALTATDIVHLAHRSATDLSGGELQRVFLARALAQQTPVLLLDEATSHLDLDHRLAIGNLLRRLNRENATTIIQVSHDLDLAAETSHRLLLLSQEGRAVALGSPDEVLNAQNLARVFQVEVKVEPNPYTGAPRVLPLSRPEPGGDNLPRIHVLCGGGTGEEILRRLHLVGYRLSAGPLNRGDSDQLLAAALGIETILEEPFSALSSQALTVAGEFCRDADALVVAPIFWGCGNLASLDLAAAVLGEGRPVLLVDPQLERDFTGGTAWKRLQSLLDIGAVQVADVKSLCPALSKATARRSR